jgi:hypothetical protein
LNITNHRRQTIDFFQNGGKSLGLRNVRKFILQRKILFKSPYHLLGCFGAAIASMKRQGKVIEIQIVAIGEIQPLPIGSVLPFTLYLPERR